MNGRTAVDEKAGSVVEITSIVHDLRNPLSAIHGCAEILISSRLSDLQVHRIARNLYGASVRMRELLDEFFSRHGGASNGVEPSDVRELVASAVDKIALIAGVSIGAHPPERPRTSLSARTGRASNEFS